MSEKYFNLSCGICLCLLVFSGGTFAVTSFFGLQTACAGQPNFLATQPSKTTPHFAEQQDKPETGTSEPVATPADRKSEDQEEKPLERVQSDELGNNACLDCHNPDILKMSRKDLLDNVSAPDEPLPPKVRPAFILGELNLSLNQGRYLVGSHADTTCVSCHNDIAELPHPQRLKKVDCKECHEESVATFETSGHRVRPERKSPECIGCHDVHYGQSNEFKSTDFKRKLCLDCHAAYKMDDIVKSHGKLYEPRLHLTLDCMLCHQGSQAGVHYMPVAKTKLVACDSCHQKKTALSEDKKQVSALGQDMAQTGFINAKVLKQFGYVIGAHRIPALDAIVILAVMAPLGLPIVHGGLRYLTRRRESVHLPEGQILLHPLIERFWHWFQAACVVMLIITGMMLHWPEQFPGWFQWAVKVHNWFGIAFLISFLVWLIYNLLTGRISHYLPKKGEIPNGMIMQAQFYGYGIFKHEHHPFPPTQDNKFNPLQKITYLFKQFILVPILLISGILYMYPDSFAEFINSLGGIWVIGTFHFALGAVFASFLIAHIYLATTGETIGENFKAMITGWGVKMEHEGRKSP
jgi:predicted CXXCH cytochrome family protein